MQGLDSVGLERGGCSEAVGNAQQMGACVVSVERCRSWPEQAEFHGGGVRINP